MKMFFDFLPVMLFFAAFKIKGIFFATAAAIVVAIIQMLVMYAWKRKIDTMLWVSALILVVFGGSTLLLKNVAFIKWKPTVLYWVFSCAIFGGKYLFKKNIIKGMMNNQFQLPEPVWYKLNIAWGSFFALVGGVNLFVAYSFSTAAWVNFKLFGILGCLVLFAVAQGLYLSPYMKETLPEKDKNIA